MPWIASAKVFRSAPGFSDSQTSPSGAWMWVLFKATGAQTLEGRGRGKGGLVQGGPADAVCRLLAPGLPASPPPGPWRILGRWLPVMGRTNVGLTRGTAMLRTGTLVTPMGVILFGYVFVANKIPTPPYTLSKISSG